MCDWTFIVFLGRPPRSWQLFQKSWQLRVRKLAAMVFGLFWELLGFVLTYCFPCASTVQYEKKLAVTGLKAGSYGFWTNFESYVGLYWRTSSWVPVQFSTKKSSQLWIQKLAATVFDRVLSGCDSYIGLYYRSSSCVPVQFSTKIRWQLWVRKLAAMVLLQLWEACRFILTY